MAQPVCGRCTQFGGVKRRAERHLIGHAVEEGLQHTIEAAAAHGAARIAAASEVYEERCIRRRLSGFGNASCCECLIDDAELLGGERQPPDFAAFADHFNGQTLTAAEAAPDNPTGTGFEHFGSPQTE